MTRQRTFEIVSLTLRRRGARERAQRRRQLRLAPGTSTRSIASAKRILVGDLNLRLFCTLFQVYRVGTSNVPRSYETTPWSGCYGKPTS